MKTTMLMVANVSFFLASLGHEWSWLNSLNGCGALAAWALMVTVEIDEMIRKNEKW